MSLRDMAGINIEWGSWFLYLKTGLESEDGVLDRMSMYYHTLTYTLWQYHIKHG